MVSAAAAYLKARIANNAVAAGVSHFGGTRIDPTLAPRLANALIDADNGVALDRKLFAFLGDSTMAGTRGAGDLRTNAWPTKLLPLMQAYAAVEENGFYGNNISTTVLSDVPVYDPRMSIGAGIAFTTGETCPGGNGYAMGAATGTLQFAPTKPYDTVDVVLQAGSAGGTVGVQFGSGGAVTQLVGLSSGMKSFTLTKPLGSEPVIFSQITGNQAVDSCTCSNSAAPRVMLANMAKAGWSSRDWVGVAGSNRTPLLTASNMRPVAVFINLGINDYSNGISVAEFTSNMQTIINQLKTGSDVILGIPFPSNITAYPTQGLYVQAIRDLAAANNLPLVDFARLFVSWEVSNALGRYIDNRHPAAPRGYSMAAKFMARSLRSLLAL